MALLALVWKIFGYSIFTTRLTMLLVAAEGVLFCFLLSIRLSRGNPGAPAFAAAIFLIASPLFYTQSMMVLLDMPAMTLTLAALLLFLDEQWVACAIACTLLALTKETAITTPLVFGAWLWFRDKKRREALYFLAPALALAGWLVVLHHSTGYWMGNAEFTRYNATGTLEPFHIFSASAQAGVVSVCERWKFPGRAGAVFGVAGTEGAGMVHHRVGRGGAGRRSGAIWRRGAGAIPVAGAADCLHRHGCSGFGLSGAVGAGLSHFAMTALLVAGWFWNPPYPVSVRKQPGHGQLCEAAGGGVEYLEAYAPNQRIASAWPFTDAISHPEFGYVERPLKAVPVSGFSLTSLASTDRASYDILVMYTRVWPVEGNFLDVGPVRAILRRYFDYQAPATDEQLQLGLGLVRVVGWERAGQSIAVYVRGD